MAVLKKEGDGKSYPSSCYLVVEDPEQVSTWHLRVKSGSPPKPDHTLMGAAFAALTNGYRGNKYEGPQKAAAMAKLRALYKAEGMDMPGKRANMSLTTVADFSNVVFSGDDDTVLRQGKIFQVGDYPDKAFSFSEEDLDAAVAAFSPCPIDLQHLPERKIPTVFDGLLGQVTRIFPSEDHKSLIGEVQIPKWLDGALEDGNRKVSAAWDRATKQLKALSLVVEPRVTDAALVAAFSADLADRGEDLPDFLNLMVFKDPEFAAEAEKTTTGPVSGANDKTKTSQKQGSKRMKIRDLLMRNLDEGEEIEDIDKLEAVFSAKAPEDLGEVKKALAEREAEIKALREAQERHTVAFEKAADEKRAAIAATFAQEMVMSHRISPASAEPLAALATRIGSLDANVTFAEGEKSVATLLQEFVETLPDLALFTTGQVSNVDDPAVSLFHRMKTPGADGKAEPNPEDRRVMLMATPQGRKILAEEEAAKRAAPNN